MPIALKQEENLITFDHSSTSPRINEIDSQDNTISADTGCLSDIYC